MRVGVYGYNLYYGGKHLLGKTPGWRWLDIRALANDLVGAQDGWSEATITRITYCTARIDADFNPNGHLEQDVYLKDLLTTGSVDHIEYGKYVTGVRVRPLAVKETRRRRPTVVTSNWPVMIQAPLGTDVPGATFMVSTLHQEEKGSDVNVATHLLLDVLRQDIDAVVLMSNDSDLKLPVRTVRSLVPLGMVNPHGGLFRRRPRRT